MHNSKRNSILQGGRSSLSTEELITGLNSDPIPFIFECRSAGFEPGPFPISDKRRVNVAATDAPIKYVYIKDFCVQSCFRESGRNLLFLNILWKYQRSTAKLISNLSLLSTVNSIFYHLK